VRSGMTALANSKNLVLRKPSSEFVKMGFRITITNIEILGNQYGNF
jgi:hypothetical protein